MLLCYPWCKVTIILRLKIGTQFEAPKSPRSRHRRHRGGIWGGACSVHPIRRNVVSSPAGSGGAPTENGFGAFWARKNASDDNEFDIGIMPIRINFVICDAALHLGRDKIGTGFGIRDNSASRKTSQFSLDRPSKFGTVPVKSGRTVTLPWWAASSLVSNVTRWRMSCK